MKYTKNHHLPQWEESDRILMSDFNKMAQDLEAALDKAKAAVDSASALAQQGVDKAEAAQQSANKNVMVQLGHVQVRKGTSATVNIPNASQFNEFIVAWTKNQPSNAVVSMHIFINGDRDDKGKYHGGLTVPVERRGIPMERVGDHCSLVNIGIGIFASTMVHRSAGSGADGRYDCTIYNGAWDDVRSLAFELDNNSTANVTADFIVYGRMN